MWAAAGIAQRADDVGLEGLADRVLEPVRLFVHLVPWHVQDIDEQPFGEPVTAHDTGRGEPASLGQAQAPLLVQLEQPLTLEPSHGLRHRRRGHAQTLDQPRAHGRDTGLLELVDRLEVVLRGGRTRCRHGGIVGGPRTFERS